MSTPPRPAALLLLAASLLLPAFPAGGQALRGVVVDDATGSPLPDAAVVLLDTAGLEVGTARTDRTGAFALGLPSAGRWTLRTDRVGYGSLLSGALTVPAGRLLVLELRLSPLPLRLEPVTVVVESRRLSLEGVGFYDRRHLGIGRFITADEIETRALTQVTDVLRMEPSVHIYPVLGGGEANAVVLTFRGQRRDFSGLVCLPTIVVDGTVVRRGVTSAPTGAVPRLDELIHPAEIEAMELYPSGAGVPPRFGGMDARCGVILIWRKRGEEPARSG